MLDISDVVEILSVNLIGIVPEDETVIISTNKGEPLTLESTSPAARGLAISPGAFLAKKIPFDELEYVNSKGMLGRIKKFLGL